MRLPFIGLLIFFSFSVDAALLKRQVITFYFGQETPELAEHPVHRFLELPLNHLGYHVVYWDLEKGFPPDDMMEPVCAIVTWFLDKKFDQPQLYAEWLKRHLVGDRRYIYFGETNLEENTDGETTSVDIVNPVLAYIGVKRIDQWIERTDVLSLIPKEPDIMNFERQIDQESQGFYVQHALSAQADIWLKARYKGGATSDLVLVTPKGGIASEGYFIFFPSDQSRNQNSVYSYATQWRIDPVRFLRQALGGDAPVFDMTTAYGRRLAFVHIDGDGWNNLSEVNSLGQSSADVIYGNILTKYNDMRFTIGPIAADLDLSWGGRKTAQETLKKIALLPHVEIASHTYSHPQRWAYYLQPRNLEEEKKEQETPRDNLKKPFDLDNEVKGSMTEILKYMPTSSSIKLYLWSGDCLPYKGVFDKLTEAKLLNLNGGSNRFDTEFPSLTGISTFYRQVGNHIQVYSAGNNEESYTYGWSDRFFGLKYFVKTLKNTENPYRIKPMNLYFNMFTGQKIASVEAAQQVLEFMKNEELFCCFASDYAAKVASFPKAKIENLAPLHWRLSDMGALTTIRFDKATEKMVDMQASKGVLGMRHFQGSLYVFLDPAEPAPEIKLRELTDSYFPHSTTHGYLLSSSWEITRLFHEKQGLSFEILGRGKGEMLWVMPKAGTYQVISQQDGQQIELGRISTTGENILELIIKNNEYLGGKIIMTFQSPNVKS